MSLSDQRYAFAALAAAETELGVQRARVASAERELDEVLDLVVQAVIFRDAASLEWLAALAECHGVALS